MREWTKEGVMAESIMSKRSGAQMRPTEHTMTTWDGEKLFYRTWRPSGPSDKALLLFHRGHEHSGRFQELVQRLNLEDAWIFAWDARGHGRSPGERGYAENLACLVKDADAFARFISREYGVPIENMVVLAHSVGGVIATAWVHDYAPPIRAMVLGCPAFRVKLYIPFALPLLRLWHLLKGKAYVRSYVKARMLTHDPEQADLYTRDPLISRAIAVNILIDLHDTSTRLMADAGSIRTPVLLLAAGSDRVVKLSAQRRFFQGVASPLKEIQVYPGFYHDIFHEVDRDLPIAKARQFIRNALDTRPVRSWVHRPGGDGTAEAAVESVADSQVYFAVRRLFFSWLRLMLKTVGRLSQGVRTGWRSGFDSGESLDYVYENRPRGITAIGRVLDRLYLNSIGWRGIRQRKVNIERALRWAIEELWFARRPVMVLDVASGPGRYILETLQALPHIEISAQLRDNDPKNLEAGRTLARKMRLSNVIYVQGDAFNRRSLATIAPPPTIAVVSGLYELFPENDRILTSLCGLHDALADGGYLIYTNQPWHPQLELIGSVLTNRQKRPWLMRCRSQAEMDELVRAAGFKKLHMEIDEYGIFTVSVAQKLPRA